LEGKGNVSNPIIVKNLSKIGYFFMEVFIYLRYQWLQDYLTISPLDALLLASRQLYIGTSQFCHAVDHIP